ncbi:MAG: hypothetical protein WC627_00980 [Legionella sp.]|jgi:hypothetical protein
MKRALILLLSITYNFSVSADQFICPQSITCNFEAATCEQIDGDIRVQGYNAIEPFIGEKTINLSEVNGSKCDIDGYYSVNGKKINISKKPFFIYCTYKYGQNASITLLKFVKELIGNGWVASGWAKTDYSCPNEDRSACIAL